MNFFVQLMQAIAVLVPDFVTLGLVTPAFFDIYCIAKTFRVRPLLDADSALQVSLTIGYLVTIAINIVGSLLTPVRSTIAIALQSNSRVEQAGHKSSKATLTPQPVGQKHAVFES